MKFQLYLIVFEYILAFFQKVSCSLQKELVLLITGSAWKMVILIFLIATKLYLRNSRRKSTSVDLTVALDPQDNVMCSKKN